MEKLNRRWSKDLHELLHPAVLRGRNELSL